MSMEKRIASPSKLLSDPAAKELLKSLEKIVTELRLDESVFYYDFPIFRDESNNLYRSKVLLVTKKNGLFVFAPVTTVERNNALLAQADKDLVQLDSILYGKFLRSKILRVNKRSICLNVSSAVVVLNSSVISEEIETESELVSNFDSLKEYIQHSEGDALTETQWQELVSLLEGTKALSRQDEREVAELQPGSRAMALAKIEEKIATFDLEQRQAAISIVSGPQRIRGIAGSGKTIVLAMRMAHLHLANPDATILMTFWTKSLYDLIKQLVTKFYRQFDDRDPNWEKVHILHAWGGRSLPGVYFNACLDNGVTAQSLREIVAVNNRTKFEQACFDLLNATTFRQKYDYVLIDEGQDLPASIYQLCFNICNGGELDRNIVWAYDELQTIMDVKPQDVSKTFGLTKAGVPLIDLDRACQEYSEGLFSHDVVLKKSYRNPPEVLMCAHALGLGLYNAQPVQILDGKSHWEDLGYKVIEGSCIKGEHTKIVRPVANSPLNLSEYVNKDDIVVANSFDDFTSECDWVVSEIKRFLDDGLMPHDILVISLDDRNAKNYFSAIAQRLFGLDVSVNNLQNATYSAPKFFIDNHVSVSTVYKAKGNEAAVVLVVGVDAVSYYLNDRRARNMLFTAFTRSRAWLRVSGIKPYASQIVDEIRIANSKYPEFEFVYPDPAVIETIQRDLSEKSVKLREMEQMMLDLGLTESDLDVLKETLKKESKIKK